MHPRTSAVNSAAPAPAPDDDPDDDDDGDTYIYDKHGRLVLAEWTWDGYLVPARPRLDHAAELAARSYQVNRAAAAGQCQITAAKPLGQEWLPASECPGNAVHLFGGARVCDRHYRALTTPLAQG